MSLSCSGIEAPAWQDIRSEPSLWCWDVQLLYQPQPVRVARMTSPVLLLHAEGPEPPHIKILLPFLLQHSQGWQCRTIHTRLILQDEGSPGDMCSHQVASLGLWATALPLAFPACQAVNRLFVDGISLQAVPNWCNKQYYWNTFTGWFLCPELIRICSYMAWASWSWTEVTNTVWLAAGTECVASPNSSQAKSLTTA